MTIAIDKNEAEILIQCYDVVLEVIHSRYMGTFESCDYPETLPEWIREPYTTTKNLAQDEWTRQVKGLMARVRQIKTAFGINPSSELGDIVDKMTGIEYDAASGRPISQVNADWPEPSPILMAVAPTAIERWKTSAMGKHKKR